MLKIEVGGLNARNKEAIQISSNNIREDLSYYVGLSNKAVGKTKADVVLNKPDKVRTLNSRHIMSRILLEQGLDAFKTVHSRQFLKDNCLDIMAIEREFDFPILARSKNYSRQLKEINDYTHLMEDIQNRGDQNVNNFKKYLILEQKKKISYIFNIHVARPLRGTEVDYGNVFQTRNVNKDGVIAVTCVSNKQYFTNSKLELTKANTRFRYPNNWEEYIDLAHRSLEALDLDFGRVDIAIDRQHNFSVRNVELQSHFDANEQYLTRFGVLGPLYSNAITNMLMNVA